MKKYRVTMLNGSVREFNTFEAMCGYIVANAETYDRVARWDGSNYRFID